MEKTDTTRPVLCPYQVLNSAASVFYPLPPSCYASASASASGTPADDLVYFLASSTYSLFSLSSYYSGDIAYASSFPVSSRVDVDFISSASDLASSSDCYLPVVE
ncbi:hypothetical protein OPV22_035214 [Ensete ventricosum]|uniref:Uncharacterized protein n=1 Tax=Ensete ventricosum TaxID=4639 RepID=A0AAX5K5N0_ENSVE|nr:hypothetical protein OPV22_035214 [Ensete ventricosum]